MNDFVVTEPLVRKLLATVDAGLVRGLGVPTPGEMCVEAAISYALGEPHSDGPSCVDPAVRKAKIVLNDAPWSSNQARASGMRRVAIAQLGSKGVIDAITFSTRFAEYTIQEIVPVALRSAASCNACYAADLEAAARHCEQEGVAAIHAAARAVARVARAARAAANAAADAAAAATYAVAAADANADADAAADDAAAAAAAYAAAAGANAAATYAAGAAKDNMLRLSASLMVRALQQCGSPGCEWLWLVDATEKEAI